MKGLACILFIRCVLELSCVVWNSFLSGTQGWHFTTPRPPEQSTQRTGHIAIGTVKCTQCTLLTAIYCAQCNEQIAICTVLM